MAITLTFKAVPSSGRQAVVRDKSGMLKCFLKSAPERGKANAELVKFLAKQLGLTQQAVELVAGHTDRTKIVRIQTALTQDAVLDRLGVPAQTSLLP